MGLTDWFVDAWAVPDGALFASRRAPDSFENAGNTIFMSVPILEPVPIGRISTALRATRNGFQAGLRDDGGVEIAFADVESLRELTRRGYLAGGLGPEAPLGGPAPRPGEGWPAAAGRVFDEAQRLGLENSPWYFGEKTGDSTQDALVNAFEDDRLELLVRRYAEATVAAWAFSSEKVPDEVRETETSDLLHWCAVLTSCGIWTTAKEFDEFASSVHLALGERFSSRLWRDPVAATWAGDIRQRYAAALIAIAPAPALSYRGEEIRRLREHLVLFECDAEHPRDNPMILDLLPCILAALVTAPPPRRAASLPDAPAPLSDWLGAALQELLDVLPSGRLPTAAEQALTEFARRMAQGHSGRPRMAGV